MLNYSKSKRLIDRYIVFIVGFKITRQILLIYLGKIDRFLGVVLLLCASILISQHWLTAIMGVPCIVQMPIWMRKSEEHLIRKFGDDYKRYMERVPRMNFVVGIIRLLRRGKELEVDE